MYWKHIWHNDRNNSAVVNFTILLKTIVIPIFTYGNPLEIYRNKFRLKYGDAIYTKTSKYAMKTINQKIELRLKTYKKILTPLTTWIMKFQKWLVIIQIFFKPYVKKRRTKFLPPITCLEYEGTPPFFEFFKF